MSLARHEAVGAGGATAAVASALATTTCHIATPGLPSASSCLPLPVQLQSNPPTCSNGAQVLQQLVGRLHRGRLRVFVRRRPRRLPHCRRRPHRGACCRRRHWPGCCWPRVHRLAAELQVAGCEGCCTGRVAAALSSQYSKKQQHHKPVPGAGPRLRPHPFLFVLLLPTDIPEPLLSSVLLRTAAAASPASAATGCDAGTAPSSCVLLRRACSLFSTRSMRASSPSTST